MTFCSFSTGFSCSYDARLLHDDEYYFTPREDWYGLRPAA